MNLDWIDTPKGKWFVIGLWIIFGIVVLGLIIWGFINGLRCNPPENFRANDFRLPMYFAIDLDDGRTINVQMYNRGNNTVVESEIFGPTEIKEAEQPVVVLTTGEEITLPLFVDCFGWIYYDPKRAEPVRLPFPPPTRPPDLQEA